MKRPTSPLWAACVVFGLSAMWLSLSSCSAQDQANASQIGVATEANGVRAAEVPPCAAGDASDERSAACEACTGSAMHSCATTTCEQVGRDYATCVALEGCRGNAGVNLASSTSAAAPATIDTKCAAERCAAEHSSMRSCMESCEPLVACYR